MNWNKVVECKEGVYTHIVRCALELATAVVNANVLADETDGALSFNSYSSLLKPYLLVLHSWTGRDAMSAIHMKGKTSILKKAETFLQVHQMFGILRNLNADQLEVGAAGIELFLQINSGKRSLASLRYVISYTYQDSDNTVHK